MNPQIDSVSGWLALIGLRRPSASTDSYVFGSVVEPSKAVVRVTVDIDAANEKPNTNDGGAITRYYYDAVNIGVQPEARNLRATQAVDLAAVSAAAIARGAKGPDIGRAVQRARLAALNATDG